MHFGVNTSLRVNVRVGGDLMRESKRPLKDSFSFSISILLPASVEGGCLRGVLFVQRALLASH